MSLFDYATKVDAASVAEEYAQLLGDGELVEYAYKLVRDVLIFTNRRLILVDKEGIRGKKVEYDSIPYKSITMFGVETAGTFNLDADFKLWTAGMEHPIVKEFDKAVDVYEVQSLLAHYVCCS